MMPRLDGFSLLRAIRDDPALGGTPLYPGLRTGRGKSRAWKALQAGADDYLVKPFTARELLARVETYEVGESSSGKPAEREERLRAAEALRAVEMGAGAREPGGNFRAAGGVHRARSSQPIGAARNNAHAALRFLAADPPDLAEVNEALECVVNETYRAGDIIGRIRDHIKKAPPRKEHVDLNDSIEEVIALVHGELSRNCVSIQTDLAAGLPPVYGDRVQLQQVMLNLILNAMEAMINVAVAARDLVISTAADPAAGVLVAVGDSGPGITSLDRERIFESFYTTKVGGVGIGLSICRTIIDAHGGRLWADARHPRGAILRFTLPVHN